MASEEQMDCALSRSLGGDWRAAEPGGMSPVPGRVGVEVGLRVLGLGVMDKPEGWCVLYLMFSSMKLTMGRAVALI